MNKAVFIDKDGTLIKNIPYNVDPEKIYMVPGAVQALQQLQTLGYRLFLISNQSGVAYGYFTETELIKVRTKLETLFNEASVFLADFYYCPHHPNGKISKYKKNCNCRKPMPGLIYEAAAEHNISLEESWFIGDILDDIEAGNRAGCHTILIDNGNETEWVVSDIRLPAAIVKSLPAAANVISDYINSHAPTDKTRGRLSVIKDSSHV